MTVLDFVLLTAVILSAFFAYNRGFSREIMAIGAWVGAALLTNLAAPGMIPHFRDAFQLNDLSASVMSYFFVFLISIVISSFLVKRLARRLHATDLKGVDQALGFIFGLFRGVLLICIFYLFMLWLIPVEENRPDWFRKARSRPVLRYGAYGIDRLFIPGAGVKAMNDDMNYSSDANTVKDTYERLLKPDIKKLEPQLDDDQKEEEGYKESERKDLERQILQLEALEKILEKND